MFSNQRRASGIFGLVGVGVMIAGWLAVAGVLISEYRHPEIKQPGGGCQLVCAPAGGEESHG
jgi:hypothetical protein